MISIILPLLFTIALQAKAQSCSGYFDLSILNHWKHSPQLQERIWEANKQGNFELRNLTETFLKDSKVNFRDRNYSSDKTWDSLNTSTKPFVFYYQNSNIKAIFKKVSSNPKAQRAKNFLLETRNDGYSEVAAYELDKVLNFNIVPVTVLRQRFLDTGSVQLMAKQDKTSDVLNRDDFFKIIIFDYLIDNWDRSLPVFYDSNFKLLSLSTWSIYVEGSRKFISKNFFLAKNGKAVAFDNGVSFYGDYWRQYYEYDLDGELFMYEKIYHANIHQTPKKVSELIFNVDENDIRAALKNYLSEQSIRKVIEKFRKIKQDLSRML